MTALLALLTMVASTLAGHHIPVVCEDVPGTSGDYVHRVDLANLQGEYESISLDGCNRLLRFTRGEVNAHTAAGVLTLAHESMHAKRQVDWQDETVTECRAIRMVSATAYLLGATERNTASKTQQLAIEEHDYIRTIPGYGTEPCSLVAWTW